MFASLVQGPLLRLFLVGALLLALQSTRVRRPAPGRHQPAGRARPGGGRRRRRRARRRARSPGSCSACSTTSTSARRSGRRRSRWASAGYLAGYVTAITVRPPWWLAGAVRRARRGGRARRRCPIIRAFVGEEHPFGTHYARRRRRRRHRRAWCSARCSCPSAAGACASSSRSGRRPGRTCEPHVRRPARPDAHRTGQTVAMAADKRAARLGVLALVATLLFGAMGTRLWFLQTVQADSLQQVVDARKTKTVRLVPERGRIFDADGRILADNQPVLSVAVDWEVINRQNRPGRAVQPPVGLGRRARRRDGGALRRQPLQPLQAAADRRGRRRERGHRHRGAQRGLPRRRRSSGAGSGCTRTPRWPATSSATWARSRPRTRRTTTASATTRRSAARTSGGPGSSCPTRRQLHGKWGEVTYEVDAANRIVREISRSEPVNGMDVQLSIDLDLQQYTERLLQTQLRRDAPASAPANPEVTKPDGVTRARSTRASPSARASTTRRRPARRP